jgi:hypothetical protein
MNGWRLFVETLYVNIAAIDHPSILYKFMKKTKSKKAPKKPAKPAKPAKKTNKGKVTESKNENKVYTITNTLYHKPYGAYTTNESTNTVLYYDAYAPHDTTTDNICSGSVLLPPATTPEHAAAAIPAAAIPAHANVFVNNGINNDVARIHESYYKPYEHTYAGRFKYSFVLYAILTCAVVAYILFV